MDLINNFIKTQPILLNLLAKKHRVSPRPFPSLSFQNSNPKIMKTTIFDIPETSKSIPSKINIKARVLQSDENVWKVQNGWVAAGRFVLENRKETVHSALEKIRNFLEALENARAFIGDPEQTFKKFI